MRRRNELLTILDELQLLRLELERLVTAEDKGASERAGICVAKGQATGHLYH